MSLKKNLLTFVIISIAGSLWHFLYEWTNFNTLIGYVSPVNESTWEHLKLLFFPAVIYFAVEYFLCGKKYDNYIPASVIGILAGMLSIVALFYTYTGVLGYNVTFFDMAIYYIAVIIMLTVRTLIIKKQSFSSGTSKIISLIAAAIILIAFFRFSYNAPILGIFTPPITQ